MVHCTVSVLFTVAVACYHLRMTNVEDSSFAFWQCHGIKFEESVRASTAETGETITEATHKGMTQVFRTGRKTVLADWAAPGNLLCNCSFFSLALEFSTAVDSR